MNSTPRTRTAAIVAIILGTAVIGAAAGAGTYSLLADNGTTVVRQVTVQGSQPASSSKLSIASIYNLAYRGVVQITATGTTAAPFGGQDQQQAQGSGWVYDSSGNIVTNQHVI